MSNASSAFVAGGGTMGARLREFDWGATPLGPITDWPAVLRVHVEGVLASRFASTLLWGPELVLIYNDGYLPILGSKPEALGRPLRTVWADAWEAIEPIARRALAGESTFIEDYHLQTDRSGGMEDAYFTFCYSPVFDEAGEVVGVLDTVVETTSKVVAQRRAAEEGERLQSLLQQMPGFIAVLSGKDHRYTYTNLGHERLVDGRPVLGRTVAEAVPEAAAQGYVALLDEVYATGKPFFAQAMPLKLSDAPGTSAIDLGLEPIRDAAGVITGVFVGGYDVTERSLAEGRLRELNAELEREVASRTMARGRTWEVSPELLAVLNAEGRFETSNPAWQTVLGYSEQEVASTPFLNFVHPDDRATVERAWSTVAQRGVSTPWIEIRFRLRHGGWRWLSWVMVPDEGKLYCSARDIQDGKEREDALTQRTAERDTLMRIVQTTGAQLQVVDLDFRYLALNQAASDEFEAIYGFRPRVGFDLMRMLNQMPDGERQIAIGFWRRAMAGESFTVEHAFGDPKHERRHYEMTFEVLRDADGAQTGAFVTSVDISDRIRERRSLQQAQEALRQAQKMEAVGQLTGGLAHDFNNLLAAISGGLQMLKLRLSQGRTGELGRFVDVAERSAQRAAALTQRLLAFSRRQTLDARPLDLNQLVAGMEELIRRSVGPDVRIDVRAQGDLWTTRADSSQLENSLLNLCINARDAMMPGGGHLIIETDNSVVGPREAGELSLVEGEYVVLCVTDTGSGIAPDIVDRVFEPFFTTKPIGQGTGLGLSMVYGFARQSGGSIRIQTTIGSGTTLSIFLPRSEERPEASAGKIDVEHVAAGHGETIVVVEDEDAIRELLADVLTEAGYRVRVAADGPAGLRTLRAGKVDLLVTDVGLPGGLNGRQVADAARTHDPGLKVLFLTGYAETAAVRGGLTEAGMEVMTKPFDVIALTERIRGMLGTVAAREPTDASSA